MRLFCHILRVREEQVRLAVVSVVAGTTWATAHARSSVLVNRIHWASNYRLLVLCCCHKIFPYLFPLILLLEMIPTVATSCDHQIHDDHWRTRMRKKMIIIMIVVLVSVIIIIIETRRDEKSRIGALVQCRRSSKHWIHTCSFVYNLLAGFFLNRSNLFLFCFILIHRKQECVVGRETVVPSDVELGQYSSLNAVQHNTIMHMRNWQPPLLSLLQLS